jgi:pimeloyl-ACP methyl ester carboxylesterase
MRGLAGTLLISVSLLAAESVSARTIGSVEFTPCRLADPRGGVLDAECARHTVPENRDAPETRRLELKLVLVPARARIARPDPVVFLAGGPGQGAVDAFRAAAPAFAHLLRDRHVLLVDQRGTGRNHRLSCPLPDWKSTALLTEALARRMARECRQELEARADLRFYTTGDYIRDLEAIRAALGAPVFNLVGGSYGTRVALEYLRRHPDGIRSVFIDSVVPPELAMPQEHARNLENALETMAARCREDAACQERFGDLIGGLRRLHGQLRQPVTVHYRHPRTNEPLSAPLSRDVLALVVRLFLYGPEAMSVLPLLLDEAASGRPESLLAQAEMIMDWVGDTLSHGMELSVLCAEDAPWLKPDPDDADTLMGEAIVQFTHAECTQWPRGRVPEDFKQPVVSGKPVLLLAGEFDPVTPPRYADQVAAHLSNSRVLVARGQGHTPMGRGCMPRLLQRFIDTLAPEELDAACLEALGESPFFLDFAGPSP